MLMEEAALIFYLPRVLALHLHKLVGRCIFLDITRCPFSDSVF
uniref:Uncharacterized protein n=1 Tax=Lepeophtheirus salmonis TaxID=72036 RepID=A0A0K2UJ23_LEPSM